MNYKKAQSALKENKKVKRPSFENGHYIFASSTNEGALCKQLHGEIEFMWQPTEEDLKAEDWEIVN